MFTIALLEPQIPPNTGNIARLCAATGTRLELVGKLGFQLDDRSLKRAGLDYWQYVQWEYFADIEQYMAQIHPDRIHLFTTKSNQSYHQQTYRPGDILIFGSEISGIPLSYLKKHRKRCRTIPINRQMVRSLNLSSSAAIVLYEALSQQSEWMEKLTPSQDKF